VIDSIRTVNVFEGSRRIALVVKVAWVIVVGLIAYSVSPDVRLTFATMHPNDPFTIADEHCDVGSDAIEWVTRRLDDKSIFVQLCFRSRMFESNETPLVPYRSNNDTMWGNDPYSTQVTTYTRARAQRFSLMGPHEDVARAAWNAERTKNILIAVLFALGGWVALSVLQALVGWIVRGFLGIPRGHDRRVDRAPESVRVSESH
jgi:hypothetical protein